MVGEVFTHVVHSACSDPIKSNSIHFKHELKDLISTSLDLTEGGYMFKEELDEFLLSDGRATEAEVDVVLAGKVNERKSQMSNNCKHTVQDGGISG